MLHGEIPKVMMGSSSRQSDIGWTVEALLSLRMEL